MSALLQPTPGVLPPTILAVDDDGDVLRLLGTALRSAGYDVLLADCGWNAIQAYENSEKRIRLLLTDVIMPDLTGPVVAERLRARQPISRFYLSPASTTPTWCSVSSPTKGSPCCPSPSPWRACCAWWKKRCGRRKRAGDGRSRWTAVVLRYRANDLQRHSLAVGKWFVATAVVVNAKEGAESPFSLSGTRPSHSTYTPLLG